MNVKARQRSPSVSVVCECVPFLINFMQVRRINTGAGVDIHGGNNVSVIYVIDILLLCKPYGLYVYVRSLMCIVERLFP